MLKFMSNGISDLLPAPYQYGDLLAAMRTEFPEECSDYGCDLEDEMSLEDETIYRCTAEGTAVTWSL